MKLHLPTSLRRYIYTCLFSVISASVGTGALWASEAADMVATISEEPSPIVINTSGDLRLTSSTPGELIILQLNGTNNYFHGAQNTIYEIDADVQIDAAIINNGYSGASYYFNGTITGDGDFEFTSNSSTGRQTYVFGGDMSAYSGDMKLSKLDSTGSLKFVGNQTGTGSISITRGNNLVIDGATMNNSAIYSTGNLQVQGNSSFDGELVIYGGSANLGNSAATFASAIDLQTGTLTANTALNITANRTLALHNNGANLNTDVVLGSGSLIVNNSSGAATGLNGYSLTLLGGTQLQLNGGNDGVYNLFSSVGFMYGADGSTLSLTSGNNKASNYFDATLPGFDFLNKSTLRLTSEGVLQLVRHDIRSLTSRRTGTLDCSSYDRVEATGIASTIYIDSSITSPSSGYGGVFHGSSLSMCNNSEVEFSGNSLYTQSSRWGDSRGGALSSEQNSTFILNNNGSVLFSGNRVSATSGNQYSGQNTGGAIHMGNSSTLALNNNASVEFRGNTAEAEISSVNSSGYGGAIYGYNSTIMLSGNDRVVFIGNSAGKMSSNCSGDGGAIYLSQGNLSLCDNGNVTFSGNSVVSDQPYSYGGAIYASYISSLSIRNNESVLFEKNAEISNEGYRLRSIYGNILESGSAVGVSFSAAEGKSIEFRDSVYLSASSTAYNAENWDTARSLKINEDYVDANGHVHKQSGDIIFTGAYTEADLLAVKGSAGTATEIVNSRTSEIHSTTRLYGGRLRVEDGVVYIGQGITAEAGADATVLIRDAELIHAGFDLTFHAGNSLELVGNTTIWGDIEMRSGSRLSWDARSSEDYDIIVGGLNLEDKTDFEIQLGERTNAANQVLLYVSNSVDGWDKAHLEITGSTTVRPEDLTFVDGLLLLNYDAATFNRYFNGSMVSGSTFSGEQLIHHYQQIAFNNISSSDSGAAINDESERFLSFCHNGSVSFSKNHVENHGGAIYRGSNSFIELSNNELVEFHENTALGGNESMYIYGEGGAIYGGWSIIQLKNNDEVCFSKNTAKYTGGAYCGYHSLLELSNNDEVRFCDNQSSYGGAIYNSVNALSLCDNGSVVFSGNSARLGGAVYSVSAGEGCYVGCSVPIGLYFYNNDSVLFEKNTEVEDGIYRLRSIYDLTYAEYGDASSKVVLSAAKDGIIEFRDSVYISTKLELNADYTAADGKVYEQTGDILFTGAYTEAHLKEVKGGVTGTAEEILASRTNEVYCMTHLYGGRLRIEDGAIYKGNGITVHEGAEATVLLKNGELSHTGHDLTFNAGTTLEVNGVNTVTAANLHLLANSELSIGAGAENTNTAVLTYTGALNMADSVALNIVSADTTLTGEGSLKLLTLANGTSGWSTAAQNSASIDLANKKLAGSLDWAGNTLCLNYKEVNGSIDWEDDSGNGRWDGISGNWGQGDYTFSFTGQLDLNFGDKGSGSITISGSFSTGDIHVNNSAGHDYHWKNDDKHAGCLWGDHSFHKEGSGNLTIDITLSYTGTTQVDGGTLTLNGIADLSGTFTNNGKLVITGTTTLGGDYEGEGDIEIAGKLKFDKHDIEIGKGKDKDKADVHNNGKGNDDNIFAADNENYEIKNGHVVANGNKGNNGNNGLHLGNKLTDTSVENAGEDTLVITHGDNKLHGVHANKGNVEVYGKDKHEMQDISISAGLTVSFVSSGREEGINELYEASISISGNAVFGKDANLIADLSLEEGASLSLEDVVHMGSDVTLNTGLTLEGEIYDRISALSETGEYVVLFDSVDALILNNGTTTVTYAPGELTTKNEVLASTIFSNLSEFDDLYITFVPGSSETGIIGGEVRLTIGGTASVPEPTTATLSLLALAAFAARRRRQQK